MAFHLVRRPAGAAWSAVITFTSTPASELGGRRVPSFPASRFLHHRRLGRSGRRRMANGSPRADESQPPVSTHEVGASDRPRHRKESAMMLKDKVAVIYGAGGAIGGAVAQGPPRDAA
jgi:hypothetical protein